MRRGRWAVFAYHTIGARVLGALLAHGQDVALVVTHEDDPAEGDWFESVAGVARDHGVPVVAPASPGAPELVARVRRLAPDVVLSVWYRRLLGPGLLAAPRVAALNLHGSLLPAYRGRAPLNWVLVNGERRTGVTLHHMTEEADAGDIVAQTALDIDPGDTALTLYGRVVEAGVRLVLDWFPAVLAGTAPRVPQEVARATVFGRRRPEDGRVAWTWPAVRIANMVRAVTHPFPGAFVGDGAARLYLWSARAEGPGPREARPGTVLGLGEGGGLRVATGDGILAITRVQPGGGLEEAAEAWACRAGLRPGDTLGEGA